MFLLINNKLMKSSMLINKKVYEFKLKKLIHF